MQPLKLASLALTAGLLSACNMQHVENWQQVPEPRQPQVSFQSYSHPVAFGYGATSPSAAEWDALETFLARLNPARGDRIVIETVDLDDAVLERREDIVAAYIQHLGFDVQVMPVTSASEATSLTDLTVSVRKAVLSVPGCPDWSGTHETYNNMPSSNFGCASAVNFSLMIADPNDLIRGRQMGPADADYLTGSIQRYRAGETTPLSGGATESEDLGNALDDADGGGS